MPKTGRPRNQTSRRALLKAAADVVRELGYAQASVSRIAARAGVGRQTIYRWWPSKAALFAEAVLDGEYPLVVPGLQERANVVSDVSTWLVGSEELLGSRDARDCFLALALAASDDAVAKDNVLGLIVGETISRMETRLRAAPRYLDGRSPRIVAEAVFGVLLVRTLCRRDIRSDSDEIARVLVGEPDDSQMPKQVL